MIYGGGGTWIHKIEAVQKFSLKLSARNQWQMNVNDITVITLFYALAGYCKEHSFSVIVTFNGSYLPFYMVKDFLFQGHHYSEKNTQTLQLWSNFL